MQHRVVFDFEVDFSNGGGIQGQGFRLDIAGADIDDAALAAYLVEDLRLLMVREVRIVAKRVVAEPHKRAPRASERPRVLELSHVIEHGLVTYKGLPAPMICDFLSREASRTRYAPGTEFQIGRIDMVANTGTYLDTPFHRYADGEDLAAVGAERLADLDAVVVDADHRDGRRIDADAFDGLELRGRAVLVRTGWDARWNTEAYHSDHPHLTEAAARYLAASGAALVGIDSFNIDSTRDGERPVHTQLLGAGIPIVEHLAALGQLPASGFSFTALPPKVRGMGTFPVRAIATLR